MTGQLNPDDEMWSKFAALLLVNVTAIAEEQEAAMRLALIAEPSRLAFLGLEARRRAELYTYAMQTTPWSGPPMSSLAAGYRSVYDDVAAGRLR